MIHTIIEGMQTGGSFGFLTFLIMNLWNTRPRKPKSSERPTNPQ